MRPLQALVISSLVPTRSRPDVGLFVARQLQLLAEQSVAASVIAPRLYWPKALQRLSRWPELSDPELALPAGIPGRCAYYFRPPGGAFTRLEGPAKAASVAWVARRWHAEQAFDVVLGIDMTSDAIAALAAARALRLPVANLAIGSDVMLRPTLYPGLRAQLARTLARSDRVLGVSLATCQALSAAGPCRKPPLCVYLGREPITPRTPEARALLRAELGYAPSDVIAIFVGRLTDEKGMNELREAALPLLEQDSRLRLVLLGAGPHNAALQALATRVGRSDAVSLLGRVPPSEVARQLDAADFMVFPSRSEGLPQAVLEAMDHGLPVVATSVGGIPEAVVDGETGLLVPARDSAALRRAMQRMLEDDALRKAAGVASLARARSVFDSTANARKLADTLRELSAARPNTAA